LFIRFAAAYMCFALFIGSAICAADAEPAALSVSVIGLRVARPNALKERVLWPVGTTVSLLISSTVGDLLHFDAVDSTLAKFVDDKGSDLQARTKSTTAEQVALAGFGHAPAVDKEAKNCVLEIFAPNLPAHGSSHVQLQGTLSMFCATQKKETIVPSVALKNGTKFSGPNKLELEVVEMNEAPRDLARDAMTFVLRAQRELDDLAEIRFFRPDGSEVKATRTSASTLSIQGAVKVDWSYTLAERLDIGTLKLYTWSDIEKKRIKLDLTIDLGL
jgi:hypothetical protein